MEESKAIEKRLLSLEYSKETIERHIGEIRSEVKNMDANVTAILYAVKGNSPNGTNGIVTDVEFLKLETKSLNETTNTHSVYFKQMTWVIGIISSVLVGVIIRIFSNNQ